MIDNSMSNKQLMIGSLETTYVICPKHGKHEHIITSTITGHEGVWCQICWIETLGPSFESVKEPSIVFEDE